MTDGKTPNKHTITMERQMVDISTDIYILII